MSYRSLASLLLCVACGLALTRPTTATSVAPLDLNQLVARADLIAIGRVTHVLDRRAAGGGTDTAIAMGAVTVLKGVAGSQVEFTVPGGRSGRYRTVVPGAPVLQERDEVVVFLRQRPEGAPILVGFSQGLMPIVRHPVTSEASVLSALAAASPDGRITRGDAARRPVPLAAFARQIHDIVDRQRALRGDTAPPSRGKQGGAAW